MGLFPAFAPPSPQPAAAIMDSNEVITLRIRESVIESRLPNVSGNQVGS